MSMVPESEPVEDGRDTQPSQVSAASEPRRERMVRSHKFFAVLAVLSFAAHLAANVVVDNVYWLPEYIWFGSLAFSIIAIYTGAAEAWRTEGSARGMAIASAVIGALVLLGLMYSGVYWLFMAGENMGPAVAAGFRATA